MPARKSQIKVIIEANGRRFSINGEWMLDGRYRIKVGRSVSQKRPSATLTEIFDLARRWAVEQMKEYDYLKVRNGL